jgi:hypothetical protein
MWDYDSDGGVPVRELPREMQAANAIPPFLSPSHGITSVTTTCTSEKYAGLFRRSDEGGEYERGNGIGIGGGWVGFALKICRVPQPVNIPTPTPPPTAVAASHHNKGQF